MTVSLTDPFSLLIAPERTVEVLARAQALGLPSRLVSPLAILEQRQREQRAAAGLLALDGE